MATLIIETTDPDFWPCPEGCGGATEDEAGGPCRRCWDKVDEPGERPLVGPARRCVRGEVR
jgi:hypothetical protein